MPDPTPEPKVEAKTETVRYHYIKSGAFRVIHVDGAIGGPTPQGLVHVALFSERFPIPLQTVHHKDGNTVLGEPVTAVARDGIVREVEADLMLTIEAARALSSWLTNAADKIEELQHKKGTEG